MCSGGDGIHYTDETIAMQESRAQMARLRADEYAHTGRVMPIEEAQEKAPVRAHR
jgi:hypothetical protein